MSEPAATRCALCSDALECPKCDRCLVCCCCLPGRFSHGSFDDLLVEFGVRVGKRLRRLGRSPLEEHLRECMEAIGLPETETGVPRSLSAPSGRGHPESAPVQLVAQKFCVPMSHQIAETWDTLSELEMAEAQAHAEAIWEEWMAKMERELLKTPTTTTRWGGNGWTCGVRKPDDKKHEG